jgi:hypothetical protein
VSEQFLPQYIAVVDILNARYASREVKHDEYIRMKLEIPPKVGALRISA